MTASQLNNKGNEAIAAVLRTESSTWIGAFREFTCKHSGSSDTVQHVKTKGSAGVRCTVVHNALLIRTCRLRRTRNHLEPAQRPHQPHA